MQFKENTISEFIKLYEEAYGEKLTPDEASFMLRKLVHLYRVLLRPLPKKENREPTQLS